MTYKDGIRTGNPPEEWNKSEGDEDRHIWIEPDSWRKRSHVRVDLGFVHEKYSSEKNRDDEGGDDLCLCPACCRTGCHRIDKENYCRCRHMNRGEKIHYSFEVVNSMNILVINETPPRSSRRQEGLLGRGAERGTTTMDMRAIGTPMHVVVQKIHLHDAHCTQKAPMMIPKTLCFRNR
jgi:hypothetical protein